MVNRVFKAKDLYGAEMEFELREPERDAIISADMQYRIAYSMALKEGILPREKMRDIFKENDIWNEADEAKITSLIKELGVLTLKLDDVTKRGDKDECIKVAEEMAKTRVQLFQVFLIQHSCFINSCEGYAELVKLEALMAASVFIKANNQRYWKTYKDYLLERDHNSIATVAIEAANVNNTILEERKDVLINDYPEQKWLHKMQADMLEAATQQAKAMIKQRVEEAFNVDVENQVTSGQNG